MEIQKPLSDPELNDLEELLNSHVVPNDGLNISALHGFLTALIVSPSMLVPSQWLPVIWGEEDPEFESHQEAERMFGLIMRLYNSIGRTLAEKPEEFFPIFLVDEDEDQSSAEEPYVLAQDWCEGFSVGVAICPQEDWRPLMEDEEGRNLLAPIIAFTSPDDMADVLEHGKGKLTRKHLIALLPLSVAGIYEFFQEHRADFAHAAASAGFSSDGADSRSLDVEPVHAAPKIGRNQPCPCGSGKKYKKCCGLRVN